MPRRRSRSRSRVHVPVYLLVGLLLGVLVTGAYISIKYGLLPSRLGLIGGFEGGRASFAGVRPTGYFDWTGNGIYHPFVYSLDPFLSHSSIGEGDNVYFMNSDPTSTQILWKWQATGLEDWLRLYFDTQANIQLQNLDYMGDPLDWNQQAQFEVVQLQPIGSTDTGGGRSLTKVVNGEETQYTFKKLSMLLVPADFHISIYIPAGQDHSEHWSGWQEGDWSTMELWFRLDFITWETISQVMASASSDSLPESETDGIVASFPESYPEEYSLNIQPYSHKGGFPVSAWIQGYLENVGSNYPEDFDEEIWEKYLSGSGYDRSVTEDSLSNLNAKTNFTPDLNGRSLVLWNAPGQSDPYANPTGDEGYVFGGKTFEVITDQAKIYPWANYAQTPSYFCITLGNMGTYTEGNPLGGYDIYYPAVNYRIRVIYCMWGEFTYLWTVKTAEDFGYPGWEIRQITHVVVDPWLKWLYDILNNPIFQLFLFLVLVLVILVVLAVFAPGVLKIASAGGKRVAQKISPKPPPAPWWFQPPAGPPRW